MGESDSDFEQIENIAENLLIGSKAYDVFPTPVDDVLSYAELTIDKNIDLSRPIDGLESIYKKHLRPGLKKLLGILDRSTNTVILDQSMNENRKRFVQLHEVGHKVLPWQEETMEFVDNEYTIHPLVLLKFEQEASYLASCVLFQLDRFSSETQKLNLSIETALDISKRYGASVHATLRRYVLSHHKPCALLVLNTEKDKNFTLEVRDTFESGAFRKKFGKINWPPICNHQYPFVLDAYSGRRHRNNGECSVLLDAGNAIKSSYHLFHNSYNYFILIIPK